MANWNEVIDKALTRLSGKKKGSTLPQLSLQVPETTTALALYDEAESLPRRERQVKQRLSYQLFEKMRRRALSWKSYYYHDEYEIPRLAITNNNATGTHIIERRYLVSEDRVVEANFYTDDNASTILIDVNDLENVHRDLFDQLQDGASSFQIYNGTYPLEIWFDSDRDHVKHLFPLGKHRIYANAQHVFLLRPFRNLGAEGFAALSNRLLAQEGITTDPKNTIESLLIELGNEELLHHYQTALNLYNQQSSMRRSPVIPTDDDLPLIITKTHQHASAHNSNHATNGDQIAPEPIPDEAYEEIALVFEKHFAEIEEDLFHISLASLSLDRASAMDSFAILKDKLSFYSETALLQDNQLEQFYRFMHTSLAEETNLEMGEEEEYSPLEDQAYQEIFVEVLGGIRDITIDPRYDSYPPIRTQVDSHQETIESLAQALEDAEDKQRHREINDKREILTRKAFEVPNTGTYHDKAEGQASYYEHLLEVQKVIGDIKNEMRYSVYDVAMTLAKSAFLVAQLHLKESPDLHPISKQLTELMQTEPTGDYRVFELEFVERFAHLTADIHGIINVSESDQLMKLTGQLEGICANNGQYDESEWDGGYVEFIRGSVADFNSEIREMAIEKYNQIAQQIDGQFQLIETFISGISVPALLPAQLHESGDGLQTFLIQQLQKYLNTQNLQLHTVPGREKQLRSLVSELMPARLETPLEQLEYFFMSNA